MASKYEPLEVYLSDMRAKSQKVSLSFKEVDQIIGSKLPRSAYIYREWWSNQADTSNRPQAKAWLSVGFQVESVRQQSASGAVVFAKR